MPNNKKSFARRRLYFLLGTVVGLIGSLISVGGTIHQSLQQLLISDDEYIAGRYGYTLEECEKGPYNARTEMYVERSKDDIKQCKETRASSAILERRVDFKDSLIGFLSRGLLFVILLVTHLPAFLRETKKG